MLTCQELLESLGEYVEGRLPLTHRAAYALHLYCCSQCRDYLHHYEATIAASKQAFTKTKDEPVPAELPEELVQAILKARNES